MTTTYTQPGDPVTLDPATLATRLRDTVDAAEVALRAISSEAASTAPGPDRWSSKQVIGHLIDSATNNLHRIVRLQLQPEIDLPGYEQDGWVRVQHYDSRPWLDVLSLWLALNRHLAHTIEHVDTSQFSHFWRFEGEHLTLSFIIEDYIAHLEHHLRTLS